QAGVRGVTDLMVLPGLINLDFADIRAVMAEMGKAMMGTGEATGERRAVEAAEAAISNPLLDDISMKGARGVLINITGGMDMTLFEVDEAANRIRDEVDPEANIIFGSTFDESLDGRMRVSVVATGIDQAIPQEHRPANLSLVQARGAALRPQRPAADLPAAATARQESAAEPAASAAGEPAAQREPEVRQEETAEQWPAFGAPVEQAAPAVAAETAEVEERQAEQDSFVAPAPMRPASRPVFAEQRPAAKPEPFKAAEFANAAQPAGERSGFLGFGKAKRPSLFERVTGAGQAPRPAPAEPAKAAPRAEPRLDQRQEPLGEAIPRPASATG